MSEQLRLKVAFVDASTRYVGQLSINPTKWSSIHQSWNSCSAVVCRQSLCCRFLHCALLLFSESCCCRATVVANSNPLLCTSCVTCCSRLMFGILSFRLVSDRAATLSSVLVPVPRLHFSLDRFSLHALSFPLTDRLLLLIKNPSTPMRCPSLRQFFSIPGWKCTSRLHTPILSIMPAISF